MVYGKIVKKSLGPIQLCIVKRPELKKEHPKQLIIR